MSSKGLETREKLLSAAESLILDKGYAGMSLDRLLAETGLTKGAFFHHFKDKSALARAVLDRYAARDLVAFQDFAACADRLSDDPRERVFIFIRLFEAYLDDLDAPFPGCIFAAYTHERELFGPEVHAVIREGLERWLALCEDRFARLIAERPPVEAVSARSLAEQLASVIEGGFIMANALDDATWTQRQLAGFRAHLARLFPDRASEQA